jgi:peptidyl-prolyl cis-trans isomerase-like 1
MANAGANSNTSQFFVTLRPTPFLDGKHTIFGRIYSGMGVIQRMGLVPTDTEDRPKIPIVIHRATPFRGPPPENEDESISFPYQSYESKVSQSASD